MSRVDIIRHKPIPVFSGTVEVLITRDDNEVIGIFPRCHSRRAPLRERLLVAL